MTPCLSPHDHCTIYPFREGTRSCCAAKESYDRGEGSVEVDAE